MKLVTLESPVHLDLNGDVTISVRIGEAQIGGGVIKLDGIQVCVTPVEDHLLGAGNVLKGKTLLIKNIVSDENPHTNKTSITYLFKQMGQEQTFISKAEVDHDKDVIGYWAKFALS